MLQYLYYQLDGDGDDETLIYQYFHYHLQCHHIVNNWDWWKLYVMKMLQIQNHVLILWNYSGSGSFPLLLFVVVFVVVVVIVVVVVAVDVAVVTAVGNVSGSVDADVDALEIGAVIGSDATGLDCATITAGVTDASGRDGVTLGVIPRPVGIDNVGAGNAGAGTVGGDGTLV